MKLRHERNQKELDHSRWDDPFTNSLVILPTEGSKQTMADSDLIQALVDGFESLFDEAKKLSQREKDLSRRLSVLNQEVF